MNRLHWVVEEIEGAHDALEFLLDDVSATEDIEDEDVRAGLISNLEDAYEALKAAMRIALKDA